MFFENELKRSWGFKYLKPLGACREAIDSTRYYPTPQIAWNDWRDITEMIWVLKSIRVNNRKLGKCIFEVFTHCHPDWKKRVKEHPKHEIEETFAIIEDYIAGKTNRISVMRRYKKLYEDYRLLGDTACGRRMSPERRSYYVFLADVWKMVKTIGEGRKSTVADCVFFIPDEEYDREATEKEHAWGRDCVRKYFPDPMVCYKVFLWNLELKKLKLKYRQSSND
jgi:hypothetical protein